MALSLLVLLGPIFVARRWAPSSSAARSSTAGCMLEQFDRGDRGRDRGRDPGGRARRGEPVYEMLAGFEAELKGMECARRAGISGRSSRK